MSTVAPRRTLLATLAVLLLGAAMVGLVPQPAHGHAAGELPHARLSAEGNTVTVRWSASADDAADVAVAAGLWPEATFLAYLDVLFGGDPALLPDAAEIAAVSADPALRRYLEDRVRIRQDGRECPGAATPAADFIADGATLVFTCQGAVTDAEVEITLLHDRDPTYRTFSADGTAQFAVHTAAQPTHPWDFTLARAQEGGAPVTWLLVAAGLVVLLAGAALARVWSSSRRAHGTATSGS